MRIGIVNDLTIVARVLRAVVERTPGDEVVWVAADGADALRKCTENRPDLVLMDLHMPVMDGVECTRRIMHECPCPIVVVTSSMAGSLDMVFRAMANGALDAIDTPVVSAGDASPSEQALHKKITVIRKLVGAAMPVFATPTPTTPPPTVAARHEPPLIVLGASTGGPAALAEVLRALGRGCAAAVVIVQHVDLHFAPGLASWLSSEGDFDVGLAQPGDRPIAGKALLAATEDHLIMTPERTLAHTAEPSALPYKPSVDVFFESVATHWISTGAAALLTGMGKDGAAGLLALRERGWLTIAQDEATCVVYGMPRAAATIGAAQKVLPLGQIGGVLARVGRARRGI